MKQLEVMPKGSVGNRWVCFLVYFIKYASLMTKLVQLCVLCQVCYKDIFLNFLYLKDKQVSGSLKSLNDKKKQLQFDAFTRLRL